MTDSHGGVSLQQQTCDRPPDDLAAADNAGVRACYFDLVSLQKFDDSCRCARNKSWAAHCQQSHICRMECIDVFRRIDGFDYLPIVDLVRKRKLYENPVNFLVVIQGGERVPSYGRACQMPDGSWVVTASTDPARAIEAISGGPAASQRAALYGPGARFADPWCSMGRQGFMMGPPGGGFRSGLGYRQVGRRSR